MHMSPDEANSVSEDDLIVNGHPLMIMTITHTFSLLRMVVGGIIGGGCAWGLFWILKQLNKESSNQRVDLTR